MEIRAERNISVVITMVDNNFPQTPACLFSSFATNTTLCNKENKQAEIGFGKKLQLWFVQLIGHLLSSYCLSSSIFNLQLHKTDTDIWTSGAVTRLLPPFAHSSSELFPSYHDRHLATAGPVTAHRPGPGVCMTLSLQQTRFSFECWVVGC